MRIVSVVILGLQIFLIAAISVIKYEFRHVDSKKWIAYGEYIMNYQFLPILFFIASFFIGIFIKEKWWTRTLVIILAVSGFVIFNKLWLFSW